MTLVLMLGSILLIPVLQWLALAYWARHADLHECLPRCWKCAVRRAARKVK